MNQLNIAIVSLKYSPVHNSHCRAIGEPLRAQGHNVRYLLPKCSYWTVTLEQQERVTFMGKSRSAMDVLWDGLALATWRRERLVAFLKQVNPSLLLFESSHPANALVISIARSISREIRFWMMIHEPYVREKRRHGYMRSILMAAQEWGVRQALPLLDGALIMSHEAEHQMITAYPSFKGQLLNVPLLFEDRGITPSLNRRYFSFIGHAVPAKGIDVFLEIIRTSVRLQRDWYFQIATSTDILPLLNTLSNAEQSRLHVVNKACLPDAEIDQAIRESWAVLAPYRRVTQSGVVPVAFMHGTPVISTRIGGMPESVIDGKTGYLLEPKASFEEWDRKFAEVIANHKRLSANCRQSFLDLYDARCGPEILRPMLYSEKHEI